MKKLLLLILLSSCASYPEINNSLNFDQEMSFEEFKIMLEKYDRVSGYPDIDN
tara:strand:- start:2128 stop:2286 length:159 start_codon:yes stop_codon:yes gene_type:complete